MRIRIDVSPVAQPRTKVTAFGGHARAYSPTTKKTAAGTVPHPIVEFKHAVRAAMIGSGICPGPIRVGLELVFPRPAGYPKDSGLPKDVWKSGSRYRHTKKPDRDNVDKAVLDALKDVTWRDDCQVCSGPIEKWVAAVGETPHVVLTIEAIGWTEETATQGGD
jgi:Holliday junction resolvase RusA-like endonuclease